MSKSVENQDNGLFALDIEPEGKTKKGRGRWPDKGKPITENKPIDIPDSGMNDANIIDINESNIGVLCLNDIDINGIGENGEKSGKESPFNRKELIFLEYYLILKENLKDAMVLAGYENYSNNHLRYLAKKIINRYEQWAGDTRKVFRDCGVGDVRLARKVDKLLNDPSAKTQLGAAELTAKVLRATTDPGESKQGINIIINTSATPAPGPGLPYPPDGAPSVEVKVASSHKPLKPLAMTK